MAVKRLRDASPGATYNGFASRGAGESPASGPPPDPSGPWLQRPPVRSYPLSALRRRKPRRSRLPWVLAGVGLVGAVGLGAVAGFYLPSLIVALRASPASVAMSPRAPAGVATPATTIATGPVLAAPPVTPVAPIAAAPTSDPMLAEPAAPAAPAAPKAAPIKAKASAPTGCAALHGASARLLCSDDELAALDDEVNARYAEAVRSGVPAGALSDEQQAWIIKRDRLARDAPDELEALYHDRIGDLTRSAQAQRQERGQGAAQAPAPVSHSEQPSEQ